MQITRGFKTELDLTNKQVTLCKKHAGAARWAYNWGLSRKQQVYQQTKQSISAMELHRELNKLKQTSVPWMYEVSKCASQEALRDLDAAFRHFFRRCRLKKEGKWRGKLGYPKFKSKKKGIGNFTLTGSIHVFEKAIQLPRLGRFRLKECGYLPIKDVTILSACVSERAGRWYVSIQVSMEVPDPVKAEGDPIGLDLGITTLATCSDGRVVANPKALHKNLKKLKRVGRAVSRKPKGSKNRKKAVKKLARMHTRIANIRFDALHKATSEFTHAPLSEVERAGFNTQLAALLQTAKTKPEQKNVRKQVKKQRHRATLGNSQLRPHMIVMEDLNVEGMKRNRKLARAISDVGMGEFRRQMAYKTEWNGETLLLADRFYPSTKRCSKCGNVKAHMDLSERVYVCEVSACAYEVGRDVNASLNLVVLARKLGFDYRELHGN
jgi:IS605 OrfB family transposase